MLNLGLDSLSRQSHHKPLLKLSSFRVVINVRSVILPLPFCIRVGSFVHYVMEMVRIED